MEGGIRTHCVLLNRAPAVPSCTDGRPLSTRIPGLTQRHRRPRFGGRSPAVVLMGIATVVSFVLVTGVTAALTVPAVAITPQVSLAAMLPANTALYVSADLNPGDTTRSELKALRSAVLSGINWGSIPNHLVISGPARHNQGCLHATVSKATDHLPDLGHATAFALIPAPPPKQHRRRRHKRKPSLTAAFAKNLVVIAPLDVRMTIADALGGVSFSLPKHFFRYHGTNVYREMVPSCDLVHGLVPSAYYAAVFKGYVILGLVPLTVEEIMDAGSGARPSLASLPPAAHVLNQMPAGSFGGFYLNSRTLGRRGGILSRLEKYRVLPPLLLSLAHHSGIVAGALLAQPAGVSLTIARPLYGRNSGHPGTAGHLAGDLPATSPLYVSTVGMKRDVSSALAWLARAGVAPRTLDILRGILHDVDGELDIAQVRSSPSTGGLPPAHSVGSLFMYWQTGHEHPAIRQDIVRLLKLLRRTPRAVRSNEYDLHARGKTASPTYALGNGWALVSSSVAGSMSVLRAQTSSPLSAIPAYPVGMSSTAPYAAVWYLNVGGDEGAVQRFASRMHWGPLRLLRPLVFRSLAHVETVTGTVQDLPGQGASVLEIHVTLAQGA